jgi:hypothetical protein
MLRPTMQRNHGPAASCHTSHFPSRTAQGTGKKNTAYTCTVSLLLCFLPLLISELQLLFTFIFLSLTFQMCSNFKANPHISSKVTVFLYSRLMWAVCKNSLNAFYIWVLYYWGLDIFLIYWPLKFADLYLFVLFWGQNICYRCPR